MAAIQFVAYFFRMSCISYHIFLRQYSDIFEYTIILAKYKGELLMVRT